MKYKKMTFFCLNNLDIYGKWEDLQDFFIENTSIDSVLNFGSFEKKDIDWEKELMNEEMELFYYVFMTIDTPPLEWLDEIAKKYTKLEFNLIYQIRDKEIAGEIVYKNGKLYHNFKTIDENQCNNVEIEVL